jgi:hypothetical protein
MTNEEMVKGGVMDIGEAQEFSGLSQSYLYALMDRGDLTYCKLGKRRRFECGQCARECRRVRGPWHSYSAFRNSNQKGIT